MFGELPKLFGRDFAIAYFLPSASFIAVTYFIVTKFQVIASLLILSRESFFRDLTAFGLAALLGAIILSVLNRAIIRTLEGYWPLNLGQYLNWFEMWRFRRLLRQDALSDRQRAEYAANEFPRKLQNKRNRIKRKKAEQFPDKDHLILPTSFGNVFRAFEIYPRAVYGIDAIPGWYRLLAVVPKDYRDLMDAARGRVDLWANVAFLAALVTIEFIVIAAWAKRFTGTWPTGKLFWFPLTTIILSYLAYRFARDAATEWGHWVKSAFDLFLPELRKNLEFTTPTTSDQERTMWAAFNRAVVYREAAAMPDKTRASSEQDIKRSEESAGGLTISESLFLETLEFKNEESIQPEVSAHETKLKRGGNS